MIRSLLLGAALLSSQAFAQTTLFEDDFESGAGNWTLNGGSGNNQWTINSTYDGQQILPDTPDQPSSFSGGINSSYMHIYVPDYCDALGLCNAGFESSYPSNRLSTQTNSISATGYSAVTLEFYYLCAGAAGSTYGSVEYSIDNGSTWNPVGNQLSGVSTWTLISLTLPAWNNQATLKFRFRWQNTSAGDDPAFSVDEIKITGMSGNFPVITTGTINPGQWCAQSQAAITVPFTVSGPVDPGNVYTAQLSSTSGSFAAPVTIGTLTSSAIGSLTISANLPGGTATGSGYRIRVVASDPATNGSDNGSNLSVNTLPAISATSGTICAGDDIILTAIGATTYTWSPPTGLSSTTGPSVMASPAVTTTYTITGTDSQGCSGSTTTTVTVEACLAVDEEAYQIFSLYPNPASELVHITSSAELPAFVTILDFSGKLISEKALTNGSFSIDDLPSGMYLVRISGTFQRISRQ